MKSQSGEIEHRKNYAGIMSKQATHKVEAAQFRGGTRQPTKVREAYFSYVFTTNKVK